MSKSLQISSLVFPSISRSAKTSAWRCANVSRQPRTVFQNSSRASAARAHLRKLEAEIASANRECADKQAQLDRALDRTSNLDRENARMRVRLAQVGLK